MTEFEPEKKRVLVLAGTYQQFRSWCKSNGVREPQAMYLSDFTRCLGWKADDNTACILTGTFSERKDCTEILSHLRASGFDV